MVAQPWHQLRLNGLEIHSILKSASCLWARYSEGASTNVIWFDIAYRYCEDDSKQREYRKYLEVVQVSLVDKRHDEQSHQTIADESPFCGQRIRLVNLLLDDVAVWKVHCTSIFEDHAQEHPP